MEAMSRRVLAASAGRDRVVDAVKALALSLVILGHGLSWTILPDGKVVNTLEAAPGLYPLTWVLQILPLFFVLAGAGMRRSAGSPSAAGLFARIDRLASPVLPLLGVTVALAMALAWLAGPAAAGPAGILPVQLIWFLGVYLLVVAAGPLLARLTRAWHFMAFLGVIALVDVLRVNAAASLGWANLMLVWAFFAAVGMHLPRLRALPLRVPAMGAVACAGAAMLLVAFGPYSAALITTTALPGLSNLAPPTLVLALAGLAQLCVLLMAWPALERLLSRDRVWVPVAVFSFRAMGLYLWHMLALSLCIAAALLSGLRPAPLSAGWWTVHLLALAATAAVVWFAAPPLLHLAERMAGALARLVPERLAGALPRQRPQAAATAAVVAGLTVMFISESGVGSPFALRSVLGLPYVPAVALVVVAAVVAAARAAGRPGQGSQA